MALVRGRRRVGKTALITRFAEKGMGAGIVRALLHTMSGHLGRCFEEAFRLHLRRLAAAGQLGDRVVRIGPWWAAGGQDEIDAVVLAQPEGTRIPVLVGEVKWAKSVNATRIKNRLMTKARNLTGDADHDLSYVVCARDDITGGDSETSVVTAADIFTSELTSLRRPDTD